NACRGIPDCRTIESNVPGLISRWSGTGTVVVRAPTLRWRTTWLPRCRTRTKPCAARIRHTSSPEKTRSLANPDLDASHEALLAQAFADLGRVGGLEEQLQRLDEVAAGFFDAVSLAGDVQLGAVGHVAVALTREDRGELTGASHAPSVLACR